MLIHILLPLPSISFLFFFNNTPTTEIYTLSLHDALPIFSPPGTRGSSSTPIAGQSPPCTAATHWTLSAGCPKARRMRTGTRDRKSTRLNSSHTVISYAVFCLKKKNETKKIQKQHYIQRIS